MPIVGPYLDPCQYGVKGTSINHYMFQLLKFIHEYLDLKSPHAVVIALIDLSKAFNRVSHSLVIEDLHDMHVPPWLLLILISYLSGRSMILTYNGASSSPKHLPGSSPQGVFLGIFFFIVKYNGVSLRPNIPRIMFRQKCRAKYRTCSKQSCKEHTKTMHALYVDDRTDAVAIDMKKQLTQSAAPRPFPLNYHERTGHVLPSGSALQKQLYSIEKFTEENQMKINVTKTKVMIFNKSRNYDFPPEFSFKNGKILECIETTKLLGIYLSSDLRWEENCKQIFKKAMSKMWLLRRLKKLDVDTELILDFYLKEIRPVAEHGVAIWNSGLTKMQVNDLEKIQKIAFKIILEDSYISYEVACTILNILPLKLRRQELCTTFAVKLYNSTRSNDYFTPARKIANTRSGQQLLVEEKKCNTKRCFNAPHNYLARLINQNKEKVLKMYQK